MSNRTWGKIENNIKIKRDDINFPPLNVTELPSQNVSENKRMDASSTNTVSSVSLANLKHECAPDEYIFTPTAEFIPSCIKHTCTHFFRFTRSIVRKLFPHDGRVKSTCEIMDNFGQEDSIIELNIPCALFCILYEFAIGQRNLLPSIYIRGSMDELIPPICRQFGGTNIAYLTTYLGLDIRLCYDSECAIDEYEPDTDLYEVDTPNNNGYNTRQDILTVLPRGICQMCLKRNGECECDELYMMNNCCNKKT